jgi:hypothetical protein
MEVLGPRLDVVGLPLNPTVRHKLQCAGFRTTADLAGVAGPVELATGALHRGRCNPAATAAAAYAAPKAIKTTLHSISRPNWSPLKHAEAQLTHEEALAVLQLAAPQRVAPAAAAASHAVSARQLYAREQAARRIITFAAELDGILGGGVETGAITEFW